MAILGVLRHLRDVMAKPKLFVVPTHVFEPALFLDQRYSQDHGISKRFHFMLSTEVNVSNVSKGLDVLGSTYPTIIVLS